MAKRMLIDATHPEETRVVVLNGTRLEEFDFETSTKKQIKGNIYLAKVTRVEPSLQAAFVEYGGNRHGFLAFSEIHPDYYRIPVSDREAMAADDRPARAAPERARGHESRADHNDSAPQRNGDDNGFSESGQDISSSASLSEAHADDAPQEQDDASRPDASYPDASYPDRAEEPAEDRSESPESGHSSYEPSSMAENIPGDVAYAPIETVRHDDTLDYRNADPQPHASDDHIAPRQTAGSDWNSDTSATGAAAEVSQSEEHAEYGASASDDATAETASEGGYAADVQNGESEARTDQDDSGFVESRQVVETLGGDEIEEDQQQPGNYHHYRHYKVQEVIKRRQILLIQVTKEERGNKGAALTTYLSLAGRYCVLMPNAGRGGGVSRKITSPIDRRRLKDLMEELQVPDGMGVIVRTAGSERSKAEIHRDYEYLLRLWDEIRDLTLRSSAPALIYEEGNLIKRAIRDLYSRDIDDILVEGEDGYRTARSFMKMLMPGHVSQVKAYRDPTVPLFHRYQVDTQIDQIHNPVVQLRSGGYIVINPTEALVAIDVNSGRSTRERNIEETATKTNLEAADEIARQLRLRDLAGLIVIDFIDMEEGRNQASVERRLKDAMRNDRARIQIGRISPFGLLELSRQRLRSSLIEASTQPCPHCNGTGAIRSTESAALVVLRALEEEGIRRRTAEITILVHSHVAFYILNQKRDVLSTIERRYGFRVTIDQDDTLVLPAYRLDRMRALVPAEIAALEAAEPPPAPEDDFQEDEASEFEEGDFGGESETGEAGEATAETQGDGQPRRKKRRRKRRRGGDDRPAAGTSESDSAESGLAAADGTFEESAEGEDGQTEEFAADEHAEETAAAQAGTAGFSTSQSDEAERRRRRRGRRGGRRRHPDEGTAPSGDLGYPPPTDFARDGREALFGDVESDDGTAIYASGFSQQPHSAGDAGYEEAGYHETLDHGAPNPADETAQPPADHDMPSDAANPIVDVGASQSQDAAAADIADVNAAPARKPRSSRRKKADSDSETEQPTAEAKPRRTRRPRGSASEEVLAAEPLELVPEPAAVQTDEPLHTPLHTERQDEAAIISGPEPETAAAEIPAEADALQEEEVPSGPKRSGWWRRLVQ